jgi:hypothetical protein
MPAQNCGIQHLQISKNRKDEIMSTKRKVLFAIKFGFCALALFVITHQGVPQASAETNFACPIHCVPAGSHCLCP